jgi:DNA-binding transcriptional MocR family regulator
MQRSELAALFKLTEEPGVISFAGGFPDPDWFLDEVREITREIMDEKKGLALSYGPTPGLTSLRDFLAERLGDQGIRTRGSEVLITSGALQGLDIVCKIFLEPGDLVIVEAPTYLGAIQTLESYEAQLVPIPIDDNGMQTGLLDEALARCPRSPKFIYTIPSFQNPSGCTMSLERRRELLTIAGRHGIPVVEDNAYAELRFAGQPLPTLKSLDEDGLVIHLGTFSKVFSPGVRLGWLVATPELVDKAILVKQGSDQCSSTLGQLIALEYGRRGCIEKQIAISKENLAVKQAATLSGLQKYFPRGASWTIPEGGFYTWVTLPGTVSTVELLPAAVSEAKVAYVAGPSFYVDRSGTNQLRLCYSQPKPDEIARGIKLLAGIFTR